LIKADGRKCRSEIHKLIIYIWYKQELPEESKDTIILSIYKNGDKTDCNNYRDTYILSPTCKILSNILLSRLTQCADEKIGDHQCGLRRK